TLDGPPVDAGNYTVTASFAGNKNYLPGEQTASIRIAYAANTLTDLDRVFNAGRVAPIKIQLLDAFGNNLSSAAITLTGLRLEQVNDDGTVTEVPLLSPGGSNPDNLFRYDPDLGGYIFNLSTKGLSAGTYQFYWMNDADEVEHELSLQLV
ncbi:MAG TPA: hypothetical protein VH575_30410, partial [Gemmataceae bacterium]